MLECEEELKMIENNVGDEYKMRTDKTGKHVRFQHSMMFFAGLLVVLIGVMIVGIADISQAADIYVDDNAASGWYDSSHVHTIQEGINNASDVIFYRDCGRTREIMGFYFNKLSKLLIPLSSPFSVHEIFGNIS